jgi:VCBS repeat-containing protein
VDGDPLSAVFVSGPAHGTLTLNSDGSFTYTPAENFCGEDSFTYKAYDGELYSNVATVTIHVTCVNDAPVARDDSYTTTEDTPLVVAKPGVLDNDYDVDGDSLTAVLVSGPAHGTLTLNSDGSFTYTPAENFCGEDSFTYKAYDGELYSNVATVTIHVTCVNDAPVARDDSYTTTEDTPLVVAKPGVLGNDYDVDGDSLTAVLVSGPAHGTLTLNSDGSFTYTPAENFCGEDSFTYKAYDGELYSNVATVTIHVTCVNDAPVARDDSYTTTEDTPLVVAKPGVLGNDYDVDGDSLTAVLVSGPAHGTLTLNSDGSFTYTPAENFCGEDSFTYKAYDGELYSNVATVTIHVTCVNDAPVARDDSYTTTEDTPLVVAKPGVLGNDYDVDGDSLTAVLVSGPAHGTLTLNSDGSFTYTPAENFCGEDSFTYKAYDGELYSNVATVTIHVTCVNDAPVARDDSYTTTEDTPLVVAKPGVLGNDYDVDGDSLTAVLVSGPAHGTLTLNSDGSFTYTPAENFCGEDSFTYKAYDGELYSNVATVTIHVTCVNDAPVARDDSYTTTEDTPLVVAKPGVLDNDYDVDGDSLTAVLVSGPAHGTLTLNSDGSFTYTPAENFCGEDSFTYKAYDGELYSNVATVTIHVTCVNDAPVARDDSYTTTEDTPLVVAKPGVLDNDYDVDGDSLTAVLVSGPAHGTLTLNSDGSFTYTPAENFCGEDSFTYKAYDGELYSNVATVTIHVTCVNDAPVARDDSYTTTEDTPLVVAKPGVLGNDYDVDGDSLTAVLVSGPAHGTLTLNSDGSFTYTPAENFCGEDSFTYKAYDGELYSNVATVTIHVTCVNDAPVARDDSYTTTEDTPLVVAKPGVLDNDYDVDGDSLTAVLVSGPAHGTLTLNSDGSFTYTPAENFCGEDSFTYKAYDGELYSNVATVTIHVTCVNDAPVARDDSYTTTEDTPLVVAKPGVLGNDYDVDGDSLTAVLVSGPAHGTLTLNSDGSFTYTPAENFCGEDSFTYKAYDGELYSNVATVTIHVTCVNDAPVARDDSYTTTEDTPLVVAKPGVLGNDYDVDGDSLTAVLVSGPAHGTLTLNSDGSFTYTPAENFCGEDSFTYKAYDGELYSNVATVRITVTCVNDAPVANDDEASVLEDSSVTIPVLGNDYDVDGDPLSVSIVSGPANGRATVNPDGTITYTPNPDFCGTDSFTYKACDPSGACDTATVTIHVTCVNDAPVAQDDTYTTNEDTPLLVPAPGVLGNDYDVDGNELLTSVLVSGPAHGTLTLNPDGSFTYTPNPKFYGTDTFTYRVFDGELYSNVATVTITVSFVNDPMEASDISLRTCVNEGKAFEVQISDLDILWAGFTGYPVTFELISGPEHGTIAGDWNAVRYEEGAALLTLLYTPDANFIGSDELRIRAFDPYGQFVVFAVRITVESCGLTPAGAAGFVPGPVVIHEIAWAGTSASAEDQWIELRNLSDSSGEP